MDLANNFAQFGALPEKLIHFYNLRNDVERLPTDRLAMRRAGSRDGASLFPCSRLKGRANGRRKDAAGTFRKDGPSRTVTRAATYFICIKKPDGHVDGDNVEMRCIGE